MALYTEQKYSSLCLFFSSLYKKRLLNRSDSVLVGWRWGGWGWEGSGRWDGVSQSPSPHSFSMTWKGGNKKKNLACPHVCASFCYAVPSEDRTCSAPTAANTNGASRRGRMRGGSMRDDAVRIKVKLEWLFDLRMDQTVRTKGNKRERRKKKKKKTSGEKWWISPTAAGFMEIKKIVRIRVWAVFETEPGTCGQGLTVSQRPGTRESRRERERGREGDLLLRENNKKKNNNSLPFDSQDSSHFKSPTTVQ